MITKFNLKTCDAKGRLCKHISKWALWRQPHSTGFHTADTMDRHLLLDKATASQPTRRKKMLRQPKFAHDLVLQVHRNATAANETTDETERKQKCN